MFKCDKCGLCCKSLSNSPLYDSLNRGDGVCKFLNGNLCSIYENRPLLCRVDEAYEAYFKSVMPLNDYYSMNYKVCNHLKTTNN